MSERLEEHITFWETLASRVKGGVNLLDAFEAAKAKVPGTRLEGVSAALMRNVRTGQDFSEAMERHGAVFSRAVRTMVRAGEAGGVLDVIMERIAEGLKDGSFPLPGTQKLERKPLGWILMKMDLITEEQLEEGLRTQSDKGGLLGQVLVGLGHVGEDDVRKALDIQAGKPTAAETARLFRAFGRLLSSGVPLMETFQILFEEAPTTKLAAAMQAARAAVLDGRSVAEALKEFPDLFAERICSAIASGERKGDLEKQASRVADALEAGDLTILPAGTKRLPTGPGDIEKDEGAHPVVKLVNLIVLDAIKSRATDVHIEPTGDERGRVRQRVDGMMRTLEPLPERMYGAVVARIKILARLDIAERRKPQDGRITIKVGGTEYALRVNVLPTTLGEAVVIRVLSAERTVLGLDQIGFARDELEKVRALCRLDQGMVIVTGPTASGSTTLLLAMLEEVDRERKCVVTVEDPVEVRIDGVEQVRVNSRIGVTFPAALRSILRHDPDVVMASHMRDLETVEVALHAALSGRLILTMLYTSSPPTTVRRLLDLGLEPFQINSALAAIISQRLVRKLCPECKVKAKVSEDRMPEEAVEFIKGRKGAKVYAPKGCDECRGGYSGRVAIHEILIPDDGFRRAVIASADAASLRKAALASGMKPMFTVGLDKAAEGVTSVEEVCRVAWRLR